MSEERIAFVFDTNFILQNHKLNEVIKQLDEKYVPYVTQVSIEERKAQQCSDKKKAYYNVKDSKKQISSLVILKDEEELNEELEKFRDRVQQTYEKYFEERVIKYDISSEGFDFILRRAFDKTPPFIEGTSDKGFKDTLLWLSIMEFFKNNGENEVIFLTDDKGFVKKADVLINEFEEYTRKTIQIKENATFDTLLKNNVPKEPVPKKEIPNIESIRKQLRDILDSICWTIEYNYYDEEEYYKSFSTSILFDEMYIKSVMENLETVIQDHLFNEKIKVSVFLDRDGRIQDKRKVDIVLIEKLNKIYKETLEKNPEHIIAMINTITEKLNENYEEPIVGEDIDAPF